MSSSLPPVDDESPPEDEEPPELEPVVFVGSVRPVELLSPLSSVVVEASELDEPIVVRGAVVVTDVVVAGASSVVDPEPPPAPPESSHPATTSDKIPKITTTLLTESTPRWSASRPCGSQNLQTIRPKEIVQPRVRSQLFNEEEQA